MQRRHIIIPDTYERILSDHLLDLRRQAVEPDTQIDWAAGEEHFGPRRQADHVKPLKRGDYFKAIYWDGSDLWLLAKRLERGRFVWPPPIVDGAMILTPAQMAVLVEAMGWRRTVAPTPPVRPMLV